MPFSTRYRSFKGTTKRVQRMRFTREDKWFAVILLAVCLLSMALGVWLELTFMHEDDALLSCPFRRVGLGACVQCFVPRMLEVRLEQNPMRFYAQV